MEKRSDYKLAVLALLSAATFLGIVPSVLKIALRTAPPFTVQFLRFLVASVLIMPFFLKEEKRLRGEFLKLLVFSLLPFLNVTLFILGIRLTNAIVSPVLYAGTPLLVVFFSWLLFKERISLLKIIGIFLGLFGVFVIVILSVIGSEGTKVGDLRGNVIILLAVFCFAFYTIFSKLILQKHSPLMVTSIYFFLTALLTFPFSMYESINNPLWLKSISLSTLLGIFYVGSLGTMVSYFLYQWGIKHSSPLEASLVFYFQPIVGFLVAVILLQERLTFLFIIGTIITLSGIFLTTTLSYLKN